MRLFPLVLLGLACGGGGGPGIFRGTVQGTSLEVKSAVLLANTEVWISSADKFCDLLRANTYPKGGSIVKFIPYPVATGDFTVDASAGPSKDHTVFVQFLKLSDTCAMTLPFGPDHGTKGTVTVTAYDASKAIAGTFDLTFGNSDAVTGSFNATYCDAPTSFPTPECQ